MGNFFTSTQIYNPEQLDKEGFKDIFCERMKEEGYELCDSESAELSYILAFSDCNKWVAITSEAYEEGNKFAHDDAGRISKMMKTTCINTTVIDSDCAVMEIYSKSGQKANTLIIGRADDYFGTKIKQPSEQVWKPFLNKRFTWEQFIEMCNSNETFVEDSLSKLAETIEMDSNVILFSVEDANEENENTVFLNFRKVSASKKKKYTLNSAFKEIFGELLEPTGFKKVKSRYPYYAKLVNNEILYVISVIPWSDSKFEIIGGIATVYRQSLSLDLNPKYNRDWLRGNYYYYGSYGEKHLTDSKTIEPLNNIYEFYSGDSLESEMKRALDVTTKVMLKIFENVTSLEKCLDFFNYFNMDIRIRYMEDFGNHYAANYFNEGLLIIKTMNLEQYSQLIDNHNIMEIEQMKNSISKGAVLGESVLIENELFKNEKIGIFKEAVCDTDWMIKANVEISNRQKNNYRLLKEYRMI